MLEAKVATIPDSIVPPLLKFMRYIILGALHLNQFTAGCSQVAPDEESEDLDSVKRKRIVIRLSEGLLAIKKRKFTISKLMESFAEYSRHTLEKQIRILATHVVVTQPTHKSVELVRRLSPNANAYLESHCDFSGEEIIVLDGKNALLTD